MAKLHNGDEILPKASTPIRAHERHRQTDRQMDLRYQRSERHVVKFE